MANEHVLHIETHLPINMTCSNTNGIEKGSLLKLADPFTVSVISGTKDIVGGVAGGEKTANDGKTNIKVYRGGIFKGVASGTITVGDPLISDTTGNKLASGRATANVSGTVIFGNALETASDTDTFLWELRPSTMSQTGST